MKEFLSLSRNQIVRKWSLLLTLSLIWGGSYILIKKSLIVFSPVQVACLRLGISCIVFSPVFFYLLPSIDWSKLKYLIVVGLTGTGFPAFLFPIAQTEISSSLAGVLSSLSPLFTLVLGVLFFGMAVQRSKIIGVILGLMGAVLLIGFGAIAGIKGNLWYGVFIIIGCFSYATSTNMVKAKLQEVSSFIISAIAFFITGIPCIFYLFSTDILNVIQVHEYGWKSLGAVALLSLAGTVLATILFFKLVQVSNPVFASLVSYLIPVVAVLFGPLDGEAITILHFLGMFLILSGVYWSRGK